MNRSDKPTYIALRHSAVNFGTGGPYKVPCHSSPTDLDHHHHPPSHSVLRKPTAGDGHKGAYSKQVELRNRQLDVDMS